MANEVIVRCLYMLSRLKGELGRCKVNKVSNLHRLKSSHFMPYNSRALTRMITVSSVSFVLTNLATTAVRAGIECEGSKVVFAQKLFLRINYAGVGRFAFALHADWGYMAEEVSEAWAERGRRRQDVFDGFHFYSLDGAATRIVFSLKLVAVNYDCRNEKDKARKRQKRSWVRAWQDSVADGLGIDADGYFLSEEDAYGALETISRQQGGRVRSLLIAQELVEFCPYSQMGDEEKNEYGGLKESGSWIKDEFLKRQDAVDSDAVRSLEKHRRARVRGLSGTLPKLLVGGVITIAAAVGTGGSGSGICSGYCCRYLWKLVCRPPWSCACQCEPCRRWRRCFGRRWLGYGRRHRFDYRRRCRTWLFGFWWHCLGGIDGGELCAVRAC